MWSLIAVVALTFLFPISAARAEADPAANLCDGFRGSSIAEQASRAIRFSQVTEEGVMALKEEHHACVEQKLGIVAESIAAYCSAREEAGHDLVLRELQAMNLPFMKLHSECEEERFAEDQKLFESTIPKSCSDLRTSFEAMLEIALDNGKLEHAEERCRRQSLSTAVLPVQAMCESGSLSVRSAAIEISERVRMACSQEEGSD